MRASCKSSRRRSSRGSTVSSPLPVLRRATAGLVSLSALAVAFENADSAGGPPTRSSRYIYPRRPLPDTTPSPSTSPTPSSTTLPPSSPPGILSGISKSAWAGIGTGVAIGVICLLVLFCSGRCAFRSDKKTKKKDKKQFANPEIYRPPQAQVHPGEGEYTPGKEGWGGFQGQEHPQHTGGYPQGETSYPGAYGAQPVPYGQYDQGQVYPQQQQGLDMGGYSAPAYVQDNQGYYPPPPQQQQQQFVGGYPPPPHAPGEHPAPVSYEDGFPVQSAGGEQGQGQYQGAWEGQPQIRQQEMYEMKQIPRPLEKDIPQEQHILQPQEQQVPQSQEQQAPPPPPPPQQQQIHESPQQQQQTQNQPAR